MKPIRFLSLLMLLLCTINTRGQDDFNPASPAEPGPPGESVPMLSLVADPAAGGTVSGAGWYEAGTSVTVRAYNKADFSFSHWTNRAGETVSTESQFRYTMPGNDETLTAHFDFNPGNPAEPSEISMSIYYRLTVMAEEGGTASGGGKYLPGSRVYVSASVNTGFTFDGWYNAAGEKLASTMGYYHTTTDAEETLTARFTFDPSSPSEPVTPVFVPKHTVQATATEGGTVNVGTTTLAEGKTITLTATPNTGYVFDGWYVGDELYTAERSFTYTMGQADILFEARFTFDPSSPAEPSMPTTHKYAFFLPNVIGKPGQTVQFPVYLTSLDDLGDMSFQLTFSDILQPDLGSMAMSEKAQGYQVAYEALNDTVYAFTLSGGTVADGNTLICMLNVLIPADAQTGMGYPVKINQVAVTETSGKVVTASTRNGRISVYKLGDTNGDDEVNVTDVMNLVYHVLEKKTEVFIEEVSDINGDSDFNVTDVMGIVEIIKNQ